MGKSILPVSIIGILSVVVILSATMVWYSGTPKPLSEHQTVINDTKIKLISTTDATIYLTPRCIETKHQRVEALSIVDIAKRALWINQQVPYSLWLFEYKAHPLAYMKIWGPYKNEVYVEVSRGAMTPLECNVVGRSFTFEFTTEDPPQSGFWYGFIEVSYALD